MESIKELRKICQKTETDERIHFLQRKVSIYLTKILLYTPITANQTTFLSMIMAIPSGIFFASADFRCSFLGILFYWIYRLLDFSDGEIARYRKQTSFRGQYLDCVAPYITDTFIFAGIGIGIYRQYYELWMLILAFSWLIAMTLNKAAVHIVYMLKCDFQDRASGKKEAQKVEVRKRSKIMSIILEAAFRISTIFSIDSTMVIYLIVIILNFFVHIADLRVLLLVFYGIFYPIFSLIRVVQIFYTGEMIGRAAFLND
ncbi:MAG: CDP-alcohol phosphatidyltransferase family protein [bacterium]